MSLFAVALLFLFLSVVFFISIRVPTRTLTLVTDLEEWNSSVKKSQREKEMQFRDFQKLYILKEH